MPLTDQVRLESSDLADHREVLREALTDGGFGDAGSEAARDLLRLLDSAREVPLAREVRLERGRCLDLIELIRCAEADAESGSGQLRFLRARIRLAEVIAAAPLVGMARNQREADAGRLRDALEEVAAAAETAGMAQQTKTIRGLIADFERSLDAAGAPAGGKVRLSDAGLRGLVKRLRQAG